MRILQITPTFFPATYWGGPIYSLYGLCNALAAQPGIDLRVLTSDAAGPERSRKVQVAEYPARYAPGYDVFFCRRQVGASLSPGMFAEMPRLIRWADVVHVTMAYSPPTIPALLLCRVFRKPVVWSPQGAFQTWKGSTRPRLKAGWDALCRPLLARDRTAIHTTSKEEAEATRRRMPGVRVAIIPNGVDLPELPASREWMPGGTLRLLYLGRLHPIKGIENLLRALASIRESPLSLSICGTGANGYVDTLRGLSCTLGLEDRVTFAGEIGPDQKSVVFQRADLCVVPSFTENFGMVVAESLAHGVPVIAARGTPWSEISDRDCGFWVDNDSQSIAAAISAMMREDLRAAGLRGRAWMEESFGWAQIAGTMAAVYQELIGAH